MTDMAYLGQILNKNNIDYDITKIYSTTNNEHCGFSMWLKDNNRHIEFDLNGKLLKER